jgi:hypothetical protein
MGLALYSLAYNKDLILWLRSSAKKKKKVTEEVLLIKAKSRLQTSNSLRN